MRARPDEDHAPDLGDLALVGPRDLLELPVEVLVVLVLGREQLAGPGHALEPREQLLLELRGRIGTLHVDAQRLEGLVAEETALEDLRERVVFTVLVPVDRGQRGDDPVASRVVGRRRVQVGSEVGLQPRVDLRLQLPRVLAKLERRRCRDRRDGVDDRLGRGHALQERRRRPNVLQSAVDLRARDPTDALPAVLVGEPVDQAREPRVLLRFGDLQPRDLDDRDRVRDDLLEDDLIGVLQRDECVDFLLEHLEVAADPRRPVSVEVRVEGRDAGDRLLGEGREVDALARLEVLARGEGRQREEQDDSRAARGRAMVGHLGGDQGFGGNVDL